MLQNPCYVASIGLEPIRTLSESVMLHYIMRQLKFPYCDSNTDLQRVKAFSTTIVLYGNMVEKGSIEIPTRTFSRYRSTSELHLQNASVIAIILSVPKDRMRFELMSLATTCPYYMNQR